MEFFKIRRDIPFMRHALVLNGISLITFLAAVFFLFSRGLHLSVEFTGGTLMEVGYSQSADLAAIRSTVDGLGIKDVQVQNFGTAQEVLIRMPTQKGGTPGQQSDQTLIACATDFGAQTHRLAGKRQPAQQKHEARWPAGPGIALTGFNTDQRCRFRSTGCRNDEIPLFVTCSS